MEVDYIEKEISQINISDVSSLIVPRENDDTVADIPEGVRILQMQPDTSLIEMREELLNEETSFESFIGGIEIPVEALTEPVPEAISGPVVEPDVPKAFQEYYFIQTIEGADTAMLYAMKGGRVEDGICIGCSNGISGEEIKNLSVIFGIDNCYNKRYFNKRVAEWTAENVQENER